MDDELIREMRNAYKALVQKPERKSPFARSRISEVVNTM
jgi:hypothetical protein